MKPNIINLEDNIESLCSFYFRLSRIDDTYKVEPIKLMKDGSIYGHSSPNEYTWKFIDGNIAFLSKDNKVSTIFNNYSFIDGKLILTGDFLLKPQLSITHKLQQIDFSWETREREGNLTKDILKEDIKKYQWEIGDHTYGHISILEPRLAKLKIGKFCSIASGVSVILGNHRTDIVTTYPFSSLRSRWPGIRRNFIDDHSTKGNVTIGNDVWIGRSATILSGVTIGDGAVIATNSLVNKDVEPYSIVGGAPAKHIKFRHSPEIISELLRIKWWDWDDETIDSRIPELLSYPDAFVNKYKP